MAADLLRQSRDAYVVPNRSNGIGLGGEESITWKPSRILGVGPMVIPADDPWQTQRFDSTVSLPQSTLTCAFDALEPYTEGSPIKP